MKRDQSKLENFVKQILPRKCAIYNAKKELHELNILTQEIHGSEIGGIARKNSHTVINF